jgi:glycosyltransferase involved in cell wall biosynthesis
MKILLVHNKYQQAGGEDSAFQADVNLLRNAGHQVFVYERDNAEINNYNTFQKVHLFKNTTWSKESQKDIIKILEGERPQIVHFHNTFPLISPSAYYVCKEAGVWVVQTLHNFRLLCPNSLFYRSGNTCEDCLGKTPPWPSVIHACYRGSRLQSAAVMGMLTYHRVMRTWINQVDIFIALSNYSRGKFIQGGLPEEKIMVRTNFLDPDPGIKVEEGSYALFVGRLSSEKGIFTLLNAWKNLVEVPLIIVGDGPLLVEAQRFLIDQGMNHVSILGRKNRQDTLDLYKQARFLVVPSECYENFPMVIVEAFANGLPVIATSLGSMREIVESKKTGLHFTLADPNDLAAKASWLWSNPIEAKRMGREARKEYEKRYTPESSYQRLKEIYSVLGVE